MLQGCLAHPTLSLLVCFQACLGEPCGSSGECLALPPFLSPGSWDTAAMLSLPSAFPVTSTPLPAPSSAEPTCQVGAEGSTPLVHPARHQFSSIPPSKEKSWTFKLNVVLPLLSSPKMEPKPHQSLRNAHELVIHIRWDWLQLNALHRQFQ